MKISTDYAHSGKYSVKLANAAVSDYAEARLWRADQYPQAAYYSAWYYLPRGYQTTNDWTIMQLTGPGRRRRRVRWRCCWTSICAACRAVT